jgi:hypothetical protein
MTADVIMGQDTEPEQFAKRLHELADQIEQGAPVYEWNHMERVETDKPTETIVGFRMTELHNY